MTFGELNLLGATQVLMNERGLKNVLETIYGENAVVQVMNGKAVQRAFWGHLLVCQCLMHQIAAKVIADDPGFEIIVQELDR